MTDLFFSEEQYREYQDELLGDGYTNEYQRVYFQSQLQHPRLDESAEAKRLTLEGKVVIMAYHERFCPVTDGFMYCDHLIEHVCNSVEEARELVAQIIEETAHGLDVGIYQLPPLQLEPRQVGPLKEFDDEIPF